MKENSKLKNNSQFSILNFQLTKAVDLANAHVKAIEYLNNRHSEQTPRHSEQAPCHSELDSESNPNPLITNIGTGVGYSVLDVVKAYEKASNTKVQYKVVKRRAGDIAKCYADSSYAKEVLGWEATRTLEQMCEDSWRWQSNNPNGYKELELDNKKMGRS